MRWTTTHGERRRIATRHGGATCLGTLSNEQRRSDRPEYIRVDVALWRTANRRTVMQYQDYYASLGVARTADAATIKKAYQKLARRFHPDVSKEKDAEETFKRVAEAYRTLKDPAARAAYDALGERKAGQEFKPEADWRDHFSAGNGSFDEADFADLFAAFRQAGRSGARAGQGGRAGSGDGGQYAVPGDDAEVEIELSVEDAFRGREVTLELRLSQAHHAGSQPGSRLTVRARVPAGATEGQRLRVPGKGGIGSGGGRRGDLYLHIHLLPHPLYRVAGHDLYIDLPLTPWEAVLGASLSIPTPAGPVRLKVAPGTAAGQQLRLPGRGLPRHRKSPGDLYALVQLVVPSPVSEPARLLFMQLAALNTTDPRAAWKLGGPAAA